ncbi:MAG: hypothetical protein ACRC1K_11610 [Planctomycetia bacterium]
MIAVFAAGGFTGLLSETGFWSILAFGLVVLVLANTVLGPILQAAAQREAKIDHRLRQAEIVREETRQQLERHERERAKAREAGRQLVLEAERDAIALKEEVASRTEAEIARLRQRVDRDRRLQQSAVNAELWSAASKLSYGVARNVLENQLTADDHRRLVDSALAEVAAQARSAS